MTLWHQPGLSRPREASSPNDEITELQTVMRLIDLLLEEASATLAPGRLLLMPNALLNLAVERMLAAQNAESIATILYRLADLIANGDRPEGSRAFPLTGHDA